MVTTHPAIASLIRELGPSAVTTSTSAVAARAIDASGIGGHTSPLALVHPTTTEQVSVVAQIASLHGIPVVPQGALTGLAGGASGIDGALLLSLTRLDAPPIISSTDQVAVVRPGVVTATLAETAAAAGLFYAPDPASAATSTIGGNIATNAGGMRCVKYGVTRGFVRQLELVLIDGTVLRTGAATVKGVAGLDLTGLVVGSEGTLAIVTEATLGLLPAPGPLRAVSATFSSAAAAIDAVRAVMASPHRPCTLEFLDATVIDATRSYLESQGHSTAGLPVGARAMLLALTDDAHTGDEDVAAYRDAFTGPDTLQISVAHDPAQVDELLAARRALNPAMRALRGGSLNEDVAVPLTRLAELLARLDELAAELGVVIATAGHVGDGNLHPVVAFDPAEPAQRRAAEAAHHRILALAVELGGTVTGEHGIGLDKRSELTTELGAPVLAIQQAIKAVLDPQNLLNPGKKL